MRKIFHFPFSMFHFKKGFTLIELLIVVAIIGILASLLMVNFIGIRQRARDSQRKSDLRQIQSALELYRADQGSYPIALLNCPSTVPTYFGNTSCTSTYMQKVPNDPLDGEQYEYAFTGTPPTTYSITACIENEADNDPNIEVTAGTSPTKIHCTGATVRLSRFKFTLTNP